MNYSDMTHKELRKILREKRPQMPYRGEGGVVGMKKPELIAAIQEAASPEPPLTFATAPEALTPPQVQTLLQISRTTFFRLVESGKMPGATKIGGSWRVWRDTLLASLSGE